MKPMNIVRKNSYAPRLRAGFTVASYRPANKDSVPVTRVTAGGELTHAAHPSLWLITWDPTEPVAMRPLPIQKDGTWYCYGLDITRNVWELFGPSRYIRTACDYTPYGSVTSEGSATQPVQWSSEVYDEELALVYYNYRHYNPMDGRWINRDSIAEQGGWNLYEFVRNKSIFSIDVLGLYYDKNGNNFVGPAEPGECCCEGDPSKCSITVEWIKKGYADVYLEQVPDIKTRWGFGVKLDFELKGGKASGEASFIKTSPHGGF